MPPFLPEIQRPNRELLPLLQKHLDNLTKPPGSLGRLEELARSFGLMRGSADLVLQKRAIFTFADRKSTRLNSSHTVISYAVFCLKKKKKILENGIISKYRYK